jgi:Protein of unknown function (DUF4038)/Domain of unknown function (DUF5060)
LTEERTIEAAVAPQWREVEITFTGPDLANPYSDVDAWVVFRHADGRELRRPVFWDGATCYRVRFASPLPDGEWVWEVRAAQPGHRFTPGNGRLTSAPPQEAAHRALTRGFVSAHPAGRSFCHADGSPAFFVFDTAWAMPWRATVEDVEVYAADRQAKGFTAVLMMSVQPDMNARGPVGRNIDEGFEVGFHDLPEGRLSQINVGYFQYFDRIVGVLVDHGITPVWQPVFHGYGWKGLEVAGPVIPPDEYARYCRYLVARFGARPAVYLPGADGAGTEPQIEAGGREIQEWDAYGQPTGIHYRPHHRNDEHQDADWLDFQSCQTGHMGDHVPDRVATMWAQRPPKAIMNGEPSYEHSGRRGVAEGWWQGHEAWSNLCAGALMGVAYGAGGLWQWRLHPQEPGHGEYFLAPGAGWREALRFEGSRYVGLVGKILEDLPIGNAAPCWDVSTNTRGLLDPGVLYLGYAEHGGPWVFLDADGRVPSRYWLIDPRAGRVLKSGARPPDRVPIEYDRYEPTVLICAEAPPAFVRGRAEEPVQ